MRHFKWLTPFIFLIGFLLLLSACGGSLQKPTGLEDNKEEQAENMKAAEANDKKRAQERTEEKAGNEDKQSKDKNKETVKKTEEKKLDAQTSTSDKEVTDKKDTTNKTDRGSSEKKESKKESNKEKTTTNQETKDKQSSSKTNKDSKDKKSNSEPKKEKKQADQKTPKPEPPKEKEKEEAPPKKEPPKERKNKVTFSIKVSSSEVILSPITIEIEDGETVLQTLSQITKEKGIQRTILSSGYVSHIGNIGEKERGPESGWMYSVNGVFPNIGAAGYTLTDGDVVEWLYTLDLGKDLGAH